MKVKPKKCKHCAKLFTPQRSSLEMACSVNCAIELSKSTLLIKGTPAFKKVSLDVKINERRNDLQKKINLLSRLIDAKCGHDTCIDCGKPFGKQIDAAHYHDMSTNRSIRFNLHNLHSARSDCNKFSSNHKKGYASGLESRYGEIYLKYVESLKNNQTQINLTATEIKEKLKIVNSIIKNIDAYSFRSGIKVRTCMNKIIGIYGN